MKKKYQYLITFLIISIITFLYSFYISKINGDEIWNYGFAHNIYNGLIPYKDFNMIIPPLFAFSTIPIFFIFGDSLLSFHIYNAIIVGLTIALIYKKIGIKSLIIYPFIILGYLPSYNLFSLFLFTILILINDSKLKYKDIYIGLLVSLIFLTKQTIGLFLIIPCLYYSKNKLKTIISFVIPILILIIYLTINDALYNFIDYCFLGMLSFVDKNNSFSAYSIITLVFSIFILYRLIKSKFKKSYYFYSLMFQIMALPMGDKYHFFISISTIIYVLLIDYKLSKIINIYILIFCYATLILITTIDCIINDFNINIYKDNNLYYGRNIKSSIVNFEENYEASLEYANNVGYDELFVFSRNAYYLKISQNQKITKFDLINNGNMGYKAHNGYIEDITNICEYKECVFIVETYNHEEEMGQSNIEILNYPKENYYLESRIGQFEIYKNPKISVK